MRAFLFCLAGLALLGSAGVDADLPVVTIDSNRNFCINGTPTYILGTIGGDDYAWNMYLKEKFHFRFLGTTATPGAHSVGCWELPNVWADPTQVGTMKTDPGYLMWDLGYEIDGNLSSPTGWVGYTPVDIAAKRALCRAYDNSPPRPVGVCWGNVGMYEGSEFSTFDGYWHSYREYAQHCDFLVSGEYPGHIREETISHAVRMSPGPVIGLYRCWPVPNTRGWPGDGEAGVLQDFWQAVVVGAKGYILDRYEMQDAQGEWHNWLNSTPPIWSNAIAKACREIRELNPVLTAPGPWTYYRIKAVDAGDDYDFYYTWRKYGSDLYFIAFNGFATESRTGKVYVPISESTAVGEVLWDDIVTGTVTQVVNSTTLKDFTANWTPNQFTGRRLRIKHGNPQHEHTYTVASNTSNTITIQSGDLIADGVAVGNQFQVIVTVFLMNREFWITLSPGTRKVVKFSNVTFTYPISKTPAPVAQASNRKWKLLLDYSSRMATEHHLEDAYGLAYDPSRRRLVAHGGLIDAWPGGKPVPTEPDVWGSGCIFEWDLDSGYYSGKIQNGMQQGGDPWPRDVSYHDLFYDPVRQCVVTYDGNGSLIQWRGIQQGWRVIPPKPVNRDDPGAVTQSAGCYLPTEDSYLFYGGKRTDVLGMQYRGQQFIYEWIWNLYDYKYATNVWTDRNNSSNLPATALESPVMAYDSTRRKAVLFGLSHDGRYTNNENPRTYFQDTPQQTYEIDPGGYVCWRKYTAHVPYVYANYDMVFDPRTNTTLLFGGWPSVNGRGTDLYEFNGTNWKRLNYDATTLPAQDQRRIPTVTYDPDHQMVIFVDTRGGKIWGLTSGLETQVTTIQQARSLADGTLCAIDGKVVGRSFSGFFYMQEPDRSCGIRVVSGSTAVAPGKVVNVIGTVQTLATGEKQIVAQVVGVAGSTQVVPLAMNNSSVVGVGYAGIMDPWGAPNVGLVVRTFGRVTHVGADHIYVDDGSAMADNSGQVGVKVKLSSAPDPGLLGQYVSATGISSVEIIGGQNARVVLVSDASDLVAW